MEISEIIDKYLPADGVGTEREELRIKMHRDIVELVLDNYTHYKLFRICEHCNKEYRLLLHSTDDVVFVNNFQICPHCGKRDDAWIKLVKTTGNEE